MVTDLLPSSLILGICDLFDHDHQKVYAERLVQLFKGIFDLAPTQVIRLLKQNERDGYLQSFIGRHGSRWVTCYRITDRGKFHFISTLVEREEEASAWLGPSATESEPVFDA